VPNSVFEVATPCSARNPGGPDGGDAGHGDGGHNGRSHATDAGSYTGLWLTAQATVGGGEAGPGYVTSAGVCADLSADEPPGVCPAITGCVTPAADSGTPASCLLPVSPAQSTFLGIETSAQDVGRTVAWKSATGVVSLAPSSAVIVAAAEGGQCAKACGSNLCAGTASAGAIGGPTVTAAVDVITVTTPGFTAPLASIRVAVQGPPKMLASTAALTNDALAFITVQDPMGFSESCTFSLPTAVQLGLVNGVPDASPSALTAGDVTWGNECPWSVDGGGPLGIDGGPLTDTQTCVVDVSAWTTHTKVFAVSYVPGLTDAVAAKAGLTLGRSITAVCQDQFGQQTVFALPAQWGAAPKPADAGTKG
jgi:hypothetical protein